MASRNLTTERDTSVASTSTLLKVPSSCNSSLRVPDVKDCVENPFDLSGIQMEQKKTKSYPCGLCADGTWLTKPQRHFAQCHKKNAIFEEIQQLEKSMNPVCTSREHEETNERIKVLRIESSCEKT